MLLSAASVASPPNMMKNELQQLLQKNGYPVPKYQLVHQQGASHVPKFTVKCVVTNNMEDIVAEEVATASTKKDAEKKAAEQMLPLIRTLLQCGPLVHSTLSSVVQPQYLHEEEYTQRLHLQNVLLWFTPISLGWPCYLTEATPCRGSRPGHGWRPSAAVETLFSTV